MDELLKRKLLAYCKLEHLAHDDAEMALLEDMYRGAVEDMADAGVEMPEPDSPRRARYDLCTFAMTLDAWDHRGTKETGATAENPAFRRRKNQLKHTEPDVSNLNTSTKGGVVHG